MPRIPQAPVTTGIPVVRQDVLGPLRTAQGVVQIAETGMEIIARHKAEQVRQERARQSEEAKYQLTRIAHDLLIESEQTPPLEAEGFYSKEFESRTKEALGGIKDEMVLADVQADLPRIREMGRFNVSRSAFARQRDQQKQSLAEGLEVYENAYARAGSDLEREGVVLDAKRLLARMDLIPTDERAKVLQHMPAAFERSRIERMIRLGSTAESEVESIALFLAARELIASDSTGLGENLRGQLQDELEAEIDQRKSRLRAEKLEREEGLVGSFLLRMEPGSNNVPTIGEIMRSGLSDSMKFKFREELRDIARGGERNKTNWNVYTDVLEGIERDAITTTLQILPLLGNGLGVPEFNQARDLIEKRRTGTPIYKRFEKELGLRKGEITRSSTILADPEGDRLYADFYNEAHQLWEEGLVAGASPAEMLNSRESKHYVFRNLSNYQRSIMEKTQSIMRDVTGFTPDPRLNESRESEMDKLLKGAP